MQKKKDGCLISLIFLMVTNTEGFTIAPNRKYHTKKVLINLLPR